MEKIFIGMIFGIIVGLLCGSLLGIVSHEYKLEKCNILSLSTNQDYYNYELQDDCYFVLNKTGLNLLLAILALGLFGAFLLGGLGAVIGDSLE